MKKKSIVLALLAICMICGAALAGNYSLMRLPLPGFHTATFGGTGKVVQIEVYGSTKADGTVQLYKLTPTGTTSNLQYTVTCSGGNGLAALTSTNTFYVSGGDVIFRTGTATNGAVRLILE